MRKKISSLAIISALSIATSACMNTNKQISGTTSDNSVSVQTSNFQKSNIEILDQRALKYLNPKAELDIVAEGFKWTEGPLWIDDGEFWLFSDIPNNVVMKYSKSEGLSRYLENSGASGLEVGDSTQGSNGLILNSQGKLVLMQQGDRRIAIMNAPLDAPDAIFTSLAGDYNGKRLNSPNDAVYDKNGNLLFTDPPYGLNGGTDSIYRELNYTGIFSLKSTGELVLLDDSIQYPNGIGLSPSGDTLYIGSSDAIQPAWFAFDVKANGHLSNKRVLFDATQFKKDTQLEGYPDGMAVHSDGVIFATGPGGVWLFDDNGVVLARIYTGKATANCALSSDEKTLFITAHDVVLTIPIL